MKHEKRPIEFKVYKAKDGFRWHCFSSNGKLIAESGEGYKQRVSVNRSIASFIDHIQCGHFTIEQE